MLSKWNGKNSAMHTTSSIFNTFTSLVRRLKWSHRQYFRLTAFLCLLAAIFAISGSCVLTSCDDDDDYDKLPRQIQDFISMYYPGVSIQNFTLKEGEYTVNIEHSATIIFNNEYVWTSLDGNGITLPQEFLFDHFPKALYDYIVDTENLNEVYSVTRTPNIYTVTLHNYVVEYNISTGTVNPASVGDGHSGIS